MIERMFEMGRSLPMKWFRRIPARRRRRVPGRFGFERLEERRVLSAATLINEIDVNCPGRSDNRYMYVELEGTPGASLNNMYFVAFQSGGNAEFVQSLSGYAIGADGLAVIKNSTGGFSIPAATTLIPNNTFFTSNGDSGFTQDTLSFYLFSSPTNPFVQGTDYDTNSDGVLDHLPTGATALDHVAVIDGSSTLTYGGVVIQNFDGGGAPDAVTRSFGNNTTTTAAWFGGELVDTGNVASTTQYDVTRPGTNMPNGSFITPGTLNYPVPAGPTLTPSGSQATFAAGSAPVVVDSGITLTDPESATISSATVTTTGFSEDAYGFTTPPTMSATIVQGHNGQGSVNVITLSGLDTVADYQAALRSITYQDTAASNVTQGTRTLSITVNDGITTTSPATELVRVTVPAPVVTASGSTGQTFTLGGSAVAVDSGITAISYDADVTGATETIVGAQAGDSLTFTTQNGISGTFASGVLSLSGSATPTQYQTALQSVTFSTTSTVKGTRTVDVVETDSNATTTASNTAVDTVVVAISAPSVTTSPSTVGVTAGAEVTINSAATVTSADTDVTGATVTITNSSSAFVTGDTLHYTAVSPIGIAGNTGGVLTLTGSATPAQYQAALRSITYSNTTNNSTTTRDVTMVVSDSNDTGNTTGSATSTITVNAPIAITGAYAAGSTWTTAANTTSANSEQFDTYLVNHSLGNASIPTLGYALQTGANQTLDIPWVNINTISVSFSGAVSNIGLGSLALVGGTGGGAVAAPTATGFASDGNNTYSWTFPSSLGNNKYIFAIATTGSSFGTLNSTEVTDASGAGISGTFTTGSSTFPSGNGLAGSTFDFAFSVLPSDGKQGGTVNAGDSASAKAELNLHETSAGYSPYFDYYGAGIISAAPGAAAAANLNKNQNSITAPAAPSGEQAGGTGETVGTASFTALALGVQETSSTTPAATTTVSNVVSASSSSTSLTAGSSTSAPAATTTTTTTTSSSTSSTGSTPTSHGVHSTSVQQHGRHTFAATDAVVSDFDLTDVWV